MPSATPDSIKFFSNTVDSKGRILVPVMLRRQLSLKSGKRVFAGVENGSDIVKFFTSYLDDKGRIIIPASIREKLSLVQGSEVFCGVEILC